MVDSGPVSVTELQRCLLDETTGKLWSKLTCNNGITILNCILDNLRTLSKTPKPRSYELDSDDNDSGPIINWHSSFEDSRWGTQSPRRSPSPTRTPQQQQQFNNQSYNISMGANNSLNASNLSNESAYMSPYAEVCRDDFPTDVRKLPALMRRAERERERSYAELADTSNVQNMDSANSFWNYCNNAAYMLKRSIYQLAPAPVASTENAPTSIEEFGIVQFKDSNSEVIKRISTVKLSQYLSNLRYVSRAIHWYEPFH